MENIGGTFGDSTQLTTSTWVPDTSVFINSASSTNTKYSSPQTRRCIRFASTAPGKTPSPKHPSFGWRTQPRLQLKLRWSDAPDPEHLGGLSYRVTQSLRLVFCRWISLQIQNRPSRRLKVQSSWPFVSHQSTRPPFRRLWDQCRITFKKRGKEATALKIAQKSRIGRNQRKRTALRGLIEALFSGHPHLKWEQPPQTRNQTCWFAMSRGYPANQWFPRRILHYNTFAWRSRLLGFSAHSLTSL